MYHSQRAPHTSTPPQPVPMVPVKRKRRASSSGAMPLPVEPADDVTRKGPATFEGDVEQHMRQGCAHDS